MLDVHMRVGHGDEVTVGQITPGHTVVETREHLADLMHEAANYLTGGEPAADTKEEEDACHD
jgi:hypothetical protein